MLTISRILLAFTLVAFGVLTACGDDDDDNAPVADTSPSATPCPSPSPASTAGVTGSPGVTATVDDDDDDNDNDNDNDNGRDDDDDDDDDNNLLGEASPTATAASATATSSTGDPCPEDDDAGDDPGAQVSVGEVSVVDFAFDPANVTVGAGDTVSWQNNGDARHTVTANDDSFDSGDLEEGQTFEFTFNEAGTFDYRCDIHPEMTGTVTVQ